MERLNENQKQGLRFLVKAVREGNIPEEFTILWHQGGMVTSSDGKTTTAIPVSRLTLDLLAEEKLLFSRSGYEVSSHDSSFGAGSQGTQVTRETYRTCVITPAGYRAVDSNFSPALDITVNRPPVEITESLERFRTDFPDSTRLAFVMMQFGNTAAHNNIINGIRSTLETHSMTALRADDKHYHDDLYFNILTYIYGVRFGIAVFERIESDYFNPNVSLEVGYMLGLNKRVCFLKDKTLKSLNTDLVGKLYRPFDPQDAEKTIPPVLLQWMDEKGFIVRSKHADNRNAN